MGVREYDYIRGNTATVPERKIHEREKNRENQKEQREKQRKIQENRKQKILNALGVGALIFTLGSATLLMNGIVYKLQGNLSVVEKSIKEQVDVSEALKVDMLKYASFDKIKNTAENELGMVYPNDKNTITIDMSKEYFSHLKKNQDEPKNTLLAKLKETFN